jgi:hypothetical protein
VLKGVVAREGGSAYDACRFCSHSSAGPAFFALSLPLPPSFLPLAATARMAEEAWPVPLPLLPLPVLSALASTVLFTRPLSLPFKLPLFSPCVDSCAPRACVLLLLLLLLLPPTGAPPMLLLLLLLLPYTMRLLLYPGVCVCLYV